MNCEKTCKKQYGEIKNEDEQCILQNIILLNIQIPNPPDNQQHDKEYVTSIHPQKVRFESNNKKNFFLFKKKKQKSTKTWQWNDKYHVSPSGYA